MALPSDAAAAGRAFRLRVATKFALAYLACSALALTAYAVSVAEREASELREAATTDLLGPGHYLSALLADV